MILNKKQKADIPLVQSGQVFKLNDGKDMLIVKLGEEVYEQTFRYDLLKFPSGGNASLMHFDEGDWENMITNEELDRWGYTQVPSDEWIHEVARFVKMLGFRGVLK